MIERCMDYRRVKKLVEWPLVISSEIIYLIDRVEDMDRGLWSFEPEGEGMKIHADLQPGCRGRKAIESAKEAFKWIFENTKAAFIYAGIPANNRAACYVATWAGMKTLGVNDNIKAFKIKR